MDTGDVEGPVWASFSFYAHAFSYNFYTQMLDILGGDFSFHSHYHTPPPLASVASFLKNKQNPPLKQQKQKQNKTEPCPHCLLIRSLLVSSFTVFLNCWRLLFWWESLSSQHPRMGCTEEVYCLCFGHQSAFCCLFVFSWACLCLLRGPKVPLDRETIWQGRRHL